VYEQDPSELWLRRIGIAAAVVAALLAALLGSASMPFDSIDRPMRVAAFGTAAACLVTAYGLVRRSKAIGWAGVAAAAFFVTFGYRAAS
jgi:hypothetical protein